VLFISAEHEITTGRSQNFLEPRHIEKIVDTFIDRRDAAGFSRLVSLDEIAANDFNLNIRRYLETGSRSQSASDARALIQGGIPTSLVLQHQGRFRNFGIDLLDLFEPSGDRYLNFPRDGFETALKRITQLASATEQIFHDRSSEWWGRAAEQLTGLTGTGSLLTSRGHFKESFYATLSDSRILSEHQLYGAFADWWEGNHDDLRRLDRGVREKEGNSRNELEQILYTLGNRLLSRLSDLVAAERQALIDLYRSWADQYATSLLDLEERRYAGARRLQSRLQQLGYPSPFTQHADSSDHQLP
jgi:type I restriction enzyme M protein